MSWRHAGPPLQTRSIQVILASIVVDIILANIGRLSCEQHHDPTAIRVFTRHSKIPMRTHSTRAATMAMMARALGSAVG
jgi:hypothetical protein